MVDIRRSEVRKTSIWSDYYVMVLGTDGSIMSGHAASERSAEAMRLRFEQYIREKNDSS